MNARMQLIGMASQNQALVGVRPNGLFDAPQLQLDIDQEKAAALGLSLAGINAELANIWGSAYVNDFIDKGRVKKVFMQGDAKARMSPEDIGRWYARNNKGEMVPFSAFAKAHWTLGSPKLERFNNAPSVAISGEPARDPVSPEDLASTIYTLLGINPERELMSPGNRPMEIVNGGSVLYDLLA